MSRDGLALLPGHHPAAGGGNTLAVLTLDLPGHSSANSLADRLAVLPGNSAALLTGDLSRYLDSSLLSIALSIDHTSYLLTLFTGDVATLLSGHVVALLNNGG